jgi:hypothetical protein
LNQRDDEFLDRNAAVANSTLVFLNERLASRSQERQVVLRETHGRPFHCGRKSILHLVAKARIGINANPFTP